MEMKDSGITWLGEVPKHWALVRMKSIFENKSVKNHPDAEVLSLYRDYGVLPKASRDDNHNVTSEDTASYKFVEVGNLVINKMKAWQGSLAISDYEGIVSPAYYVCAFKSGNYIKRYYHYLLRSGTYAQEFECLSTGMRVGQWDLGINDFMCVPVLQPPQAEQTAIAAYLDDQCAQIDSIIAETKASIEEYKKWKAAVIFEAVTKGLDPEAEMKDSGIEWIGEISKGYSIVKMRHLIKDYKAGPFGSTLITGNLNTAGNILVYTPEHIAKQSVDIEGNLYLPKERREELSQFFVDSGNIVFPIVGSLGRAMLITDDMPEGIINQRLAKFYLRKDLVDIDYFMWIFAKSSFYSQFIEVNCRGSFIMNLTKTIIYDMPVVVPSNIDTQRKIAEYLHQKCTMIDNAISEKHTLLADLEAYKKSLIYETVTGKRKVV